MAQTVEFLIKQQEKGFTLIELMIVIAIIGVLASIAIPQFAVYRQRSFNSSALSDLRNYKVSEETFSNDQRAFGYSTDGGNAGALSMVTGPGDLNTMITNGVTGLIFGLSNRVSLYGVVDGAGLAYNVTVKHVSGNVLYGVDSDLSSTFWLASTSGATLAIADTPAAVTPGNEFGVWNNL